MVRVHLQTALAKMHVDVIHRTTELDVSKTETVTCGQTLSLDPCGAVTGETGIVARTTPGITRSLEASPPLSIVKGSKFAHFCACALTRSKILEKRSM